jgi:hypothetical protein
MNLELAKVITLKELCVTLKNITFNLKGDEKEAVECVIYIIDKHLNGDIRLTQKTKIEIKTLIDNL